MAVIEAEVTGRRLVANRNFVLLWIGQFISQLGDRLAMVAFPWLVYQSTASAFSTGVVLALYTLPYVLFGAFAGAIIDRWDKRRLMVVADWLRAGLVFTVPFLAEQSLAGVYVVSFLMASVTVFFEPCKLAIMPDIVRREQLLRANSALAMGETFTEVLGYSAAGFIAYYLSTRVAFFTDSLTFLASALSLSAMHYSPPIRQAASRTVRHLWREIAEGLDYLRHHAGLMANTLLVTVAMVGLGAGYPLTFLLAVRVLGEGTRGFGLMEGSIGLGYLAGSVVMGALGERVRKGYAMTIGLLAMGVSLALISRPDDLVPVLILYVCIGVGNAAALISIDTYFQQTVAERLRGRVWGVRFTLTQTVYALSILAGGALATTFSVQPLFVVAGLIVALPGLVGLFVPRIRDV